MSEELREYESSLLKETRLQREHELKLANIAADKEVQLAEINKKSIYEIDGRRNLIIGILVGLFLLAAGAGMWYGIIQVHESDRLKFNKQTEIQQETIQKCITEGNIWHNGDCLLSKRDVPAT